MRVEVSSTKCCGYGICAETCPTVFKLDDQGFAYVDGDVSPEDEAAVMEAVDSCPEEAISVLDGDEPVP